VSACENYERVDVPKLQAEESMIQAESWPIAHNQQTQLNKLVSENNETAALKQEEQAQAHLKQLNADGASCATKAEALRASVGQWSEQSKQSTQQYVQNEEQQAQAAQAAQQVALAQTHQANAKQGNQCLQDIPAAKSVLDESLRDLIRKCGQHASDATRQSENLAGTQKTSKAREEEGKEFGKDVDKKITRYGYEGDPHKDSYTEEGIAKFSEKDTDQRRQFLKEDDKSEIKNWDKGKLGKYYKQESLLKTGDVALSHDLTKGLDPMQPLEITYKGADGTLRTVEGRFADTTAESVGGKALRGRVDLYDPNGIYSGVDGSQVVSIKKLPFPGANGARNYSSFENDWSGGFAGDYGRAKSGETRAPASAD